MKYQIVATLGPSSSTPETWRRMIAAGATAFRLNTSHLTLNETLFWLERLSDFFLGEGPGLPIILDLQGSKWRIGQIESYRLEQDERVELVCAASSQSRSHLPVPHPDFFTAASQSSRQIVLNDAKVILQREVSGPNWMSARVVQTGEISARKGITYAESGFRNETLTDRDQEIFKATRGSPKIQYALSYLRDSIEMLRYRQQFGRTATLIAKIERQTAVDDAAVIAREADGVWLCRGDLGAELGLAPMSRAVNRFTRQIVGYPVPVLMAGQVLEHMRQCQQPTRSEVCYLLDCLKAGYKGVVLSDETAIGDFPVESCQIAALFIQDEKHLTRLE
jgi:pyruvate kinase